jgi:hypothetical protein
LNILKKYLTTFKIMLMLLQESGPPQTGYDTGKRFKHCLALKIPIQEVAHARCVSTATQLRSTFFPLSPP